MKHTYHWGRPLLAALLLFCGLGARAQQAWRPFRPGLIYSYEVPGATSSGHFATLGVYTLRLDSAYVTASGDSVWAFNRVMRDVSGHTPGNSNASRFRKSRNNLFGQRLLWQPGSWEYTLETVTEGTAQVGTALRLRPRAAVASSWVANASLGLNATLTSRGLQTVNGQLDTVATITFSTGPVVRLSRRFGLLEGPQWLALSGTPQQWVATQLPAPLSQTLYSPLRLVDLQPGDELGYRFDGSIVMQVPCSWSRSLSRILTRRQTNDSLVYTYMVQSRNENSGAPGCGTPAGVTYSSIGTGRWAFSLTTGRSNQFPDLPMLTGEYRLSGAGSVSMSRGIVQLQPGGSGCGGNQLLAYEQLFSVGPQNGNGVFGPIVDLFAQTYFSASLGLGVDLRGETYLAYYRRTRNGTTTTCGSPLAFVNLLPTRAAQGAAVAALHPNPATESATLTLAQPARAGHTLRLTDALGRTVWSAPVPAGQTAVAVPLAGQPAGLYLLHLSGAEASGTWKLVHE
ncbi:T9SS type A sorting domain-containing protein [Hymenobacter ruricola]|uniref:T9SS type A sorting domain-containing protein n=1 Tax=Hymenobacter ruricola TaxID=2791023 RepID=A0ABS0I5T4_9BACT|nr:T9SS type A sorting domain-containing protein [Hymenobacter ruricola]MBF9222244.1 T9SS type A sorting domain-containing protein [Hymenobacter ruricola]